MLNPRKHVCVVWWQRQNRINELEKDRKTERQEDSWPSNDGHLANTYWTSATSKSPSNLHHQESWHASRPLLLLLLLSHFSLVRLYATPSLGFSRQEHWSGLPFPSPMHKSGKWQWSRSVMFDSSRLHGLQPTRLLRPWDFPGKSTVVGRHCLLRLLVVC